MDHVNKLSQEGNWHCFSCLSIRLAVKSMLRQGKKAYVTEMVISRWCLRLSPSQNWTEGDNCLKVQIRHCIIYPTSFVGGSYQSKNYKAHPNPFAHGCLISGYCTPHHVAPNLKLLFTSRLRHGHTMGLVGLVGVKTTFVKIPPWPPKLPKPPIPIITLAWPGQWLHPIQ